MTTQDLLVIMLGALSVALAILVWLVQRRERLDGDYVNSEEW